MFELAIIASLISAWGHPSVRTPLLLALASHAAMRIWSAVDFIPKALAFERADPATIAEDAARRWSRRSIGRLPLDLLTCGAMLAALSGRGPARISEADQDQEAARHAGSDPRGASRVGTRAERRHGALPRHPASQLDLHPTAYKALSIPERLGAMSVAGGDRMARQSRHRLGEEPGGPARAEGGDIELGTKVHITGLRISDGHKSTCTVYVK